MTTGSVPECVADFLLAETPESWVLAAVESLPDLLIDHGNCEKKAAATAVSMLFRYGEYPDIVRHMSRLAREELRHFEQVQKILVERNISYRKLSASRYAQSLHRHVRSDDPGRLVDTLIVGALIEARSCERFARLAPHLDDRLRRFYLGLVESESRHFRDYLELAERYSQADEFAERVALFSEVESDLATRLDKGVRFHSGPPADGTNVAVID